MNIRKEYDYCALYAGIDQATCVEYSQMELYCELGRLICARSEKGAAVAAATYLTEKYPNQEGFSARNVRRMRDFYKMYADVPELLDQAMLLGWTQNVVILEADLTLEERTWYLRAAGQFGWSKLTLQKKIAEAAHLVKSFVLTPEEWYEERCESADVNIEECDYTANDCQYVKNNAKTQGNTALCTMQWNCIAKPRCSPWPRGEPRCLPWALTRCLRNAAV